MACPLRAGHRYRDRCPHRRGDPPVTEIEQTYLDTVHELIARMDDGDDLARRAVGALALLASGWRLGDLDPPEWTDPPPALIIQMADYR